MTSPSDRFDFTRKWLHEALHEYHELREELEEADDDSSEVFIIGSKIPKVLQELSAAAAAHAITMERKMDSIYQRDLFGEDLDSREYVYED